MECEQVRAALSARLDGEPDPAGVDGDVVDAHLASCGDCRDWYASVGDLGRRLRVTSAGTAPAAPAVGAEELAERMLATVEDAPGVAAGLSGRSLSFALSRVALGVLAVVYAAWAVVVLSGSVGGAGAPAGVGGAVGNAADPGAARMAVDSATVRFALGAGLLWAALRPRAAGGLLPVFLALWGFGAGFATRDVVLGYIDLPGVLGLLVHLAAVGAIIWSWLARHHAVSPLRQSWRLIAARPLTYSPGDVERNSSFRPGDSDGPEM